MTRGNLVQDTLPSSAPAADPAGAATAGPDAAPGRQDDADRNGEPDGLGTYVLTSESVYESTKPAMRAFVFRHMDEAADWPTVQVRHGSRLRPLGKGAPVDVTTEVLGRDETIDSFMVRFGIAACMVVKDGEIRAQRYLYGNTPSSRPNVQSVTKAFTSTALAVAVKNGKIGSIDDPVTRYLPEMRGSAYGRATVRDLIDMTSGACDAGRSSVAYEPTETPRRKYYSRTEPDAVINWLRTFGAEGEPGEVYRYSDLNFYLVSVILERAVGMPVEAYIAREIWEPAGMQYDAYMRQTHARQTDGHGGMSMTAPDLARFGLFVMDNLRGQGGPDVPKHWFRDIAAARTSTGIRAPGALDYLIQDFGYEHGWWTLPRGRDRYELGDDGGFAAIGHFGQALFIVPGANTVAVIQSAATGESPERYIAQKQLVTSIVLKLKREDGQ
ncbi:serine hydrolase domain-containing protein [Streptomyces sp. NPDC090075]|uniref:serine hydrolase domain-containing protein n=1 Tax=Streptomyces sp. NPDC090075 TaxID=3365937 RepID=UPI0037F82B0D